MPREKEARFKGQEKFAHVRPVNSTEHTLPGGFPIWYEARQNNPIGWTGVNVFLGEAIEVPDMARQIDAGLSDNKTVQGFKRLWRFPYGTTYDQARLWSRQTVHFTMHYLLEVAGIRPDQIGLVALASGTPDGDLFLKEILKESDLKFPQETYTQETNTACNSTARGFARGFETLKRDPRLAETYMMVIAVDALGTHLLVGGNSGYNDIRQIGDKNSLMIFSNGAGGWLVPFSSISVESNRTVAVRDDKHNLAAMMTYSMNPGGGLIQQVGNTERILLPEPSGGFKIEMKVDGGGAARMFFEIAKRFLQPYDGKTQVFHIHGAGDAMVAGFRRILDVDSNLAPWVVEDGNMSSAALVHVKNRLMENVKHGDRVEDIGIGAGAQATEIKYKIL